MGMAVAASERRLKNGGRHPTIGTTRLAGWKTMTDKKILLVDDEVDVLRVFARALGKIGYTVYTAVRGSAALEILRNETIQVMFFDLNMPEMNGLELCRRVRKEFPTAVIHAVTGYAPLFELAACREAGFDDYYTKPVELDVLIAAAESAFEKMERGRSSKPSTVA